jgi:RNA polymerase sigma factor (sigma-70 family)
METLSLTPDVDAARRGDARAFTRLVDQCRAVISSIVLAIVRDPIAAEDLSQEVLLHAWKDLGRLRNPDSFLPWLRQLARNRAHEHLRARVRFRARHVSDDDALAIAADAADASAQLVSAEERALLEEVLAYLPDEAREVVTLYYREGRSARQVGALLGLGESAVKKRLERARSRLRAALLERFAEVAQRTAPGAAFSAAVALAIAGAAPSSAAAATVATAGASTLGKIAGALAGAGLGIVLGVGGVLLGFHFHLRDARDDEERRGLKRLAFLGCAIVLADTTAMEIAGYLHSALGLVAAYVALIVAWLPIQLVWLPRTIARRLAAERAEDPAACARHRRRRRARLGLLLGGYALAGAAVAWAALRFASAR